MQHSKSEMGQILLRSAYELKEDWAPVEDIYLNAKLDGGIPEHSGFLDLLCIEGTMESKVFTYSGFSTKRFRISYKGTQLVESNFKQAGE